MMQYLEEGWDTIIQSNVMLHLQSRLARPVPRTGRDKRLWLVEASVSHLHRFVELLAIPRNASLLGQRFFVKNGYHERFVGHTLPLTVKLVL